VIMNAFMSTVTSLAIIGALGAAYLAPSIIGWLRDVRDIGAIVVINVAFGWTAIGWFIALALAFRTATNGNPRKLHW
jgi:hypothetical protein